MQFHCFKMPIIMESWILGPLVFLSKSMALAMTQKGLWVPLVLKVVPLI